MAKNALYQDFTEGDHFINLNNDIEVSRENAGSRGPIEEMLRLSWECFASSRTISNQLNRKYVRFQPVSMFLAVFCYKPGAR